MKLHKPGESMTIDGVTFTVGDRVYANEQSWYEGLTGTILEINTESDKDTDNTTDDVICDFMEPEDPVLLREIEQRLSTIHGAPKKITDFGLDYVIMAPSMLQHENN